MCAMSGGQEKALNHWELGLQVAVSTMWVLGMDPGSSGRAIIALHLQTIPQAPEVLFFSVFFLTEFLFF